MLTTKEYAQRIVDFQKNKAEELKRPVTFYEAIALWFSQTVKERAGRTRRLGKMSRELEAN